jgi:hypothetical protein
MDAKEGEEMKKRRWLSYVLLALLLAPISVLVGCGGGGGGGNNNNPGAAAPTAQNPYEIAQENGFTGTEEQWLSDVVGVGPEVCKYCHNGEVARNGKSHQDEYDDLFQQDVVEVSGVNYENALVDDDGNPNTPGVQSDIVTFKMTKNGDDFDCTKLNGANLDGSKNSLNIAYTQYTNTTNPAVRWGADPDGNGEGDRIDLKGTVSYDGTVADGGTNTCKSVKAQTALGNLADDTKYNGIVVVYGENEILSRPANTYINLGRYPFSGYKVLGTVNYNSAANATGCENCHQTPYYKHGYIRGDISGGKGLDFYACKLCHLDNASGHTPSWQFSVDQPQEWAILFLQAKDEDKDVNALMTPEQKTQYAYKLRLMNDVHMSHSMEFPYPQPIRTCATCHEGKLDRVLTDENFTLETCLSCHPVTGGTDDCKQDSKGNCVYAVDTRPMALKTLWENADVSSIHLSILAGPDPDMDPSNDCNVCHAKNPVIAVNAPVFSELHTGYEPRIYYKDEKGNYQHYRDAITASIEHVTLTGTVLTIEFSAQVTNAGTAAGLTIDGLVPTVQVSFYGYDTKDFLVSNHTRDANENRMEFSLDSKDNALFTKVDTGAPGSWKVELDFSKYVPAVPTPTIPEMIHPSDPAMSPMIKKAEVIVRPSLKNADGNTVGLNAVSRTVDVTADGFDRFVANYFQGVDAPDAKDKVGNALVKVEKVVDPKTDSKSGCNSCHDQLAITFHSGDRGGNIVVCRSCHVVTEGGSHLEGQSRSIDSYVHAIHRFQAFDVDEIDFNDPVEKAKYEEHVEFLFPDFAAINCERCHTDERFVDNVSRGTFDIPDQSRSMPGLLSATDELPGFNLNATPEVVVGPAARACGGCHRAQFIKEDDPGGYAVFNEHTKRFGYRVENDDDDYMLYAIIKYIMGLFQ